MTQKVLARFKDAVKIEIKHYKDVFCRPNQDFQLQKSAQKLILAVKKDNFIYKGPEICQNFGSNNFYYTSSILNCIYHCDYCYLQGMYPSANITAFVNIDDFFEAVSREQRSRSVYLTVSYDTDLLAFENIIPFSSMWIEFAKRHRNTTIEIRTKSANYSSISHLDCVDNVILAWTLSPEAVIEQYEKWTPTLKARLFSIEKALSDGWKVRLCFDPVIKTENYRETYGECIRQVFSRLPGGKIHDVSIGAFRMSAEYLKRIRKSRIDLELVHYPFECRNGVARYPEALEKELVNWVYECIGQYIAKKRIFL
ncbi:MAG: radical SAM protein [Clostridiales bacterium]|nr:radical SAM protein [Eubacteriales bacterium]MDH7564862.1 radical SAM protein [Clostridiales bacterium]